MKKLQLDKWHIIFLFTIQFFTYCGTSNILSQVIGKEWKVTSIAGKVLKISEMENGLPYMTFGENGILSGFTGCNLFSGSYKLKNNIISLEPGAITKKACTDITEMDFLNALKEVTGWKLEGNNLDLLYGEKPVITLIHAEK
jgi:heat shock protein HslJ